MKACRPALQIRIVSSLRWEFPLAPIESANQSIFDLLPRSDGTVEFCLELCGVSDLLPPTLGGSAEAVGPRRKPHYRTSLVCSRTPEVPLLPAPVSGLSN
jgi:hypothetical protein